MLHDYIKPTMRKKTIGNNKIKKQNNIAILPIKDDVNIQPDLIQNITKECKKDGMDIVEILSQYITVEVV